MTRHGQNSPRRRTAALALAVAMALPGPAIAGAFIFAGDANGLDVITHPSGYFGQGGTLYVEVCVAADTADARVIPTSALNVAKEFNLLTPSSPNLVFGGANDIPSNAIDFESLTLHEIGHCVGLAHPNLATESGLPQAERDYTKTTTGANATYDLDAGGDAILGSADDVRGDDTNLHWFEVDVNNPLQLVATPEAGTYTRDVAQLPAGDTFVANADRDVAAALGFPNTEAAMQQGQFFDEDQRRLTADDVNTLRMAMTGLDETSGTADDYEMRLIYGGVRNETSGCDIVIRSSTSGFGVCSTGGTFSGPGHVTLVGPTYTYNSTINWYFNTIPRAVCSAPDDTLSISSTTHSDERYFEACSRVDFGAGYTVEAGGDVTTIAPRVTLGPGTSIRGRFRTYSAVP